MGDDAKLVLARSLDDARVGEVVPIDKEGNVKVPAAWPYTLAPWALVAAVGAISFMTGAYWLLFVLSAALFVFARWIVATAKPLQTAMALVAANRDDEAEALLTQRSWRPSFRLQVDTLLARLAWRRGDHPRALALLDRVIAAVRGGRGCTETMSYMCRADRARLLVIMGRAGEVAADELDDTPGGEWFVASRRDLALVRAFYAGDAAALPDDDTLHEWARAALMRNQYVSTLGYLAWAFDARGDAEMASHLVAEAQERQLESPEKDDPRLREWLAARAAAAA